MLLFGWAALKDVSSDNCVVFDDVVSKYGKLTKLVNASEFIVVTSTLPFKYVLPSFLKLYDDEPFDIDPDDPFCFMHVSKNWLSYYINI